MHRRGWDDLIQWFPNLAFHWPSVTCHLISLVHSSILKERLFVYASRSNEQATLPWHSGHLHYPSILPPPGVSPKIQIYECVESRADMTLNMTYYCLLTPLHPGPSSQVSGVGVYVPSLFLGQKKMFLFHHLVLVAKGHKKNPKLQIKYTEEYFKKYYPFIQYMKIVCVFFVYPTRLSVKLLYLCKKQFLGGLTESLRKHQLQR